jgi:hypothetical protein
MNKDDARNFIQGAGLMVTTRKKQLKQGEPDNE